MTLSWHATALRRAALAVSVLDDIDLTPDDEALVLPGPRDTVLPWWVIRDELGEVDPEGPTALKRLSQLLRLHRFLSTEPDAQTTFAESARLLALPRDHHLLPGACWIRDRVLGGALVTGIGTTGVLGEDLVPLPWSVAEAAGLPLDRIWDSVRAHAQTMGTLAVQRLSREPGSTETDACVTARQSVLRPMGGVDVLSLLATRPVRRYLARSDGSGMRAVAVPMRTRGWFDLARIDPAFVQAAWTATEPEHRGLPRPLLVTADEVALAPAGPAGADALADPAARVRRATRSVRYWQVGPH